MRVPRTIVLGAVGALAVAVHFGLGAALLASSPWAGRVANVVLMIVVLIVVVKILLVVLVRFGMHVPRSR